LNAKALAVPSIANFYAVKKQRCRKGTLRRHRGYCRPVRGNVRVLSLQSHDTDFNRLHRGLTPQTPHAAYAKCKDENGHPVIAWAGVRIL
jgi:hypothetical protein